MSDLEDFFVEGEDGARHRVIATGAAVTHGQLAGRRKDLLGSVSYQLEDGRHLNPVRGDPEAFKIFDTDEIVRKVR